jgi:hypothetical protein
MPKLSPPLARIQHAGAAGEAGSEPLGDPAAPSSSGMDDAALPLSRGWSGGAGVAGALMLSPELDSPTDRSVTPVWDEEELRSLTELLI